MKLNKIFFSVTAVVYVCMLLHYTLTMWESKQRYGIIFLTLSLILISLQLMEREKVLHLGGKLKEILVVLLVLIIGISGIYIWVEYPSLVWERAGMLNTADFVFAMIFIVLVIVLTWSSSGAMIPMVTLVFVVYALLGHLLASDNFFYHGPIGLKRFSEIAAAEISGIFGSLNQIGATWIAIFTFFAGFVQGYGGLDYVIYIAMKGLGKKSTMIPQIAVFSSMAFGTMSGSAGANAASTGAFTIPLMKKFKMPPAKAAAVESVASSGGQVMPPILGAVAFVMCDYLNMHYYQILFASLFPSIIYFGSTVLSVYFLSKRNIPPNQEVLSVDLIDEEKTFMYYLQGLPILISFLVLLITFIVYKVDILLGGYYSIIAFLISRFVYDLIAEKGNPKFIWRFTKNFYQGIIKGTRMTIPIAGMLATLGIVLRVLTTTGLAEKMGYFMVSTVGGNFALLLFFTMIICIIFGMAVSTVAAYIIVITLAAPGLEAFGVPMIVTHFMVFYWAMLSAITPPVASVCVITSALAGSNYFSTCWESMKLGFPKFILPFVFVTQPGILEFNLEGFGLFISAFFGFAGLSAAIQSGYGWWQQILLFILGIACILIENLLIGILICTVTLIVLYFMWKKYSDKAIAYEI